MVPDLTPLGILITTFESIVTCLPMYASTNEIFIIKDRIKNLNVYKRQALRKYARTNVSEEILSALDEDEEPEWMKRSDDDSDF